ncbi:ABC transporter permease [Nocardioides bruguierae]|uniref:ABC transporter permease n=1 Tax=Nocardioides bruguierae TaxID=2945102 RepID=UPI002022255B|nr:ABC transporter permease [Nocardioides bruguierae]MCL8023947.1 ABC transporter permease [Nocardioides bruguierae]
MSTTTAEQTSATTTPAPAARRPFLGWHLVAEHGVLLLLVALVVLFSVLVPDTFPTWANARLVLANLAIPGILALAALFALTVGEFDLSLGATLGFSAITAVTFSNAGLPVLGVVAATLVVGLLVGAVNALLIVVLDVNAFIATLGVGTLLAGGNLLLTDSSLLTVDSDAFGDLTTIRLGGLQVVLAYFVVVALVQWFVVERTPFGRYSRATGLGRPAARLAGVNTRKYLVLAFLAGAVLAALAGVLQASRAGSTPPSLGPDFLLPAYAAAFLGATTIRPGTFNVPGTVLSVVLLAVGTNGLVMLGADTWVTNAFNGGALILAVVLSRSFGQRSRA